jgi:hypothetical protein
LLPRAAAAVVFVFVVVLVVLVVVVLGVAIGSCAECVADTDCALVQVCAEGRCAARPGVAVALVSPLEPVADTFDVVVDIDFDGPEAVLTLARDEGDPGEPCLPFLPRMVVVAGTGDHTTERVTFADVPGLGASFSLRLTLENPGSLPLTRRFSFIGEAPGDDVGGATILLPGAEVDVDATPLATLSGSVRGRAVAFVVPVSGPPTPRVVVADRAGALSGRVPLVRGSQVVWVETDSADGVRRCGRAVVGLPAGDDGGVLDVTLVATAAEPAWVALSLRIDEDGAVDFCGAGTTGPADAPRCSAGRPTAGPSPVVTEQLRLTLDDGVIDVGVVPRIAVGPVQGVVRLTHAGRHVGFLGPFSFLPEEGQSWIAGRVLVAGGVVVQVTANDDVVVGAPW